MLRTFEINNRRYLGNKFKLLPFIRRIVDEECNNVTSVLDAFSGTGQYLMLFQVLGLFPLRFLISSCWSTT